MFQHAAEEVHKRRGAELAARHIEMQIDRPTGCGVPARCIAASNLEHPISDCSDQSSVFSKSNELVGGNGAQSCIVPASECLKSHDAVQVDVEDGLVRNKETVVVDCLAQRAFHVDAALRLRAHHAIEGLHAVTPIGLRLIDRKVCVLQQRVGKPAVLMGESDTN